MKVAIIGYGFVGKALKKGLQDDVKTLLIDPKLNTEISDLRSFLPDIVFICVPTPMNDDGSQDLKILNNITNELKELSLTSLIVIKSTVLPNHVHSFEQLFPNFVYNPEFLRERYANEDFINSELIILGGNQDSTKSLANFYRKHTKCISTQYQYTDLISASLIKYSINTFLSNKVIFFNQLHEIFKKSGSTDTWDNFTNIISADKRIGDSHMKVPGIDGKMGFGGPCFPKDCNALLKYSTDLDVTFTLLNKSVDINNEIRNQYNSLSEREIEQNISYIKKEIKKRSV